MKANTNAKTKRISANYGFDDDYESIIATHADLYTSRSESRCYQRQLSESYGNFDRHSYSSDDYSYN